jgi:hypothetical protein
MYARYHFGRTFACVRGSHPVVAKEMCMRGREGTSKYKWVQEGVLPKVPQKDARQE